MTVPVLALSLDDRVRLPASVFEHEGFRAWARANGETSGARVAFVCGEVLLEMSPESIETHNKPKAAITARLSDLVETEDLGEVYADGALLSHSGANVSTEPDLTFASWKTLESNQLRLVRKADRTDEFVELEGTPDLVVEIVSDSSVRKDLDLLRAGYARAGIPEYWLVDARRAAISFQILRLAGTAYEEGAPGDAPQASRVFGRTFTLTRSKNRVDRWTYRLLG